MKYEFARGAGTIEVGSEDTSSSWSYAEPIAAEDDEVDVDVSWNSSSSSGMTITSIFLAGLEADA